ncbi:hypothetical protein U0070_008472 [Myodes glareolus]|uniref:Secreted protein n=1 Tax=Myodes glareolus TaxID=447135 RepID=A0AAW0I637_MYOGA
MPGLVRTPFPFTMTRFISFLLLIATAVRRLAAVRPLEPCSCAEGIRTEALGLVPTTSVVAHNHPYILLQGIEVWPY